MSQYTNKVLGIDFGAAHTGLAITDALRVLAHPFATLSSETSIGTVHQIAEVITEEQVSEVVLGLPRNMDGSYGVAARKTYAFAKLLRVHIKCPLHFWDERWTTIAAQRALHEAGKKAKNCKLIVDQVAAQILLQSWLDAQSFSLLCD